MKPELPEHTPPESAYLTLQQQLDLKQWIDRFPDLRLLLVEILQNRVYPSQICAPEQHNMVIAYIRSAIEEADKRDPEPDEQVTQFRQLMDKAIAQLLASESQPGTS